MHPPASTKASSTAKLVFSSAVQSNTFPPSARGVTSIVLSPIRRFSTISTPSRCLLQSASCRSVHHFFVKFSDTRAHVGEFDTRTGGEGGVDALITFWSHALAAMLFVSLLLWRLGDLSRQPGQRLLLAAFALTACWGWL